MQLKNLIGRASKMNNSNKVQQTTETMMNDIVTVSCCWLHNINTVLRNTAGKHPLNLAVFMILGATPEIHKKKSI